MVARSAERARSNSLDVSRDTCMTSKRAGYRQSKHRLTRLLLKQTNLATVVDPIARSTVSLHIVKLFVQSERP
jgi:hypothetical protein